MAKAKKVTEQEAAKKSIFNLGEENRWKLKYISFKDEKTQTEIVNEALQEYFSKWEKKNGLIPNK